jgi:hypothetical protein
MQAMKTIKLSFSPLSKVTNGQEVQGSEIYLIKYNRDEH